MWPMHPLSMTVLSGKMRKLYVALVADSVLGLAKGPTRPGSRRLVAIHDPYGLVLGPVRWHSALPRVLKTGRDHVPQ